MTKLDELNGHREIELVRTEEPRVLVFPLLPAAVVRVPVANLEVVHFS